MAISIREHCIPAYNCLSDIRKVAPIPPVFESIDEKTAFGVIGKLKVVCDSDFFKSLPDEIDGVEWKGRILRESDRIYNDLLRG